MTFSKSAVMALAVANAYPALAGCPFAKEGGVNPHLNPYSKDFKVIGRGLKHPTSQLPLRRERRRLQEEMSYSNQRVGDGGIPDGGFDAVREALKTTLTTSQDFFPADFEAPIGPNYGGLMIRLAWHCNGSYRHSDGRGGCDGGNIRFDPELNWEDNASLDKALQVLQPVKDQFGEKLSWGDLIVLAGDTAIAMMGGPVLGFCGGRIDNADGSTSALLGPTDEQLLYYPCEDQGFCESPLGPSTIGLIYVNPAGPANATGDPEASARDIREVFSRMGFDDRTSVALIGGGHAFGKAHGPCTDPPCGEGDMQGIGVNTFTSGFEGKWTTIPTTWSNQYFTNLYDYNWTSITGPAGNVQWAPSDEGAPDIFMLTSDIALARDLAYDELSREYAEDITSLEKDFSESWYRLMTNDMGGPARCINDDAPAAQWWQYALPAFEGSKPDYAPIKAAIQETIDSNPASISAFAQLALGCTWTYRSTDYLGGCNGARVRFSPEADWDYNAGSADTLSNLLQPIQDEFPEVSYADLIVLAGNTAIEKASGKTLPFCGGRVDAENGDGSEGLGPRTLGNPFLTITDDMAVKGLSMYEGVALFATPKDGSTTVSNQYFQDLKANPSEYTDKEQALLEGDLAPIVDEFISDNELFLKEYANAWHYMMTADRYDGPQKNACEGVDDLSSGGSDAEVGNSDTENSAENSSSSALTSGIFALAAVAMSLLASMA